MESDIRTVRNQIDEVVDADGYYVRNSEATVTVSVINDGGIDWLTQSIVSDHDTEKLKQVIVDIVEAGGVVVLKCGDRELLRLGESNCLLISIAEAMEYQWWTRTEGDYKSTYLFAPGREPVKPTWPGESWERGREGVFVDIGIPKWTTSYDAVHELIEEIGKREMRYVFVRNLLLVINSTDSNSTLYNVKDTSDTPPDAYFCMTATPKQICEAFLLTVKETQ